MGDIMSSDMERKSENIIFKVRWIKFTLTVSQN